MRYSVEEVEREHSPRCRPQNWIANFAKQKAHLHPFFWSHHYYRKLQHDFQSVESFFTKVIFTHCDKTKKKFVSLLKASFVFQFSVNLSKTQQFTAMFSTTQQYSAIFSNTHQFSAILNNVHHYSATLSNTQQCLAILSNTQQCSYFQQFSTILSNV